MLTINTLMEDGNRSEICEMQRRSHGTIKELFFDTLGYEDIRSGEEPRVREYREQGLSLQSLNSLQLG